MVFFLAIMGIKLKSLYKCSTTLATFPALLHLVIFHIRFHTFCEASLASDSPTYTSHIAGITDIHQSTWLILWDKISLTFFALLGFKHPSSYLHFTSSWNYRHEPPCPLCSVISGHTSKLLWNIQGILYDRWFWFVPCGPGLELRSLSHRKADFNSIQEKAAKVAR
jgi:hypothetical protein